MLRLVKQHSVLFPLLEINSVKHFYVLQVCILLLGAPETPCSPTAEIEPVADSGCLQPLMDMWKTDTSFFVGLFTRF